MELVNRVSVSMEGLSMLKFYVNSARNPFYVLFSYKLTWAMWYNDGICVIWVHYSCRKTVAAAQAERYMGKSWFCMRYDQSDLLAAINGWDKSSVEMRFLSIPSYTLGFIPADLDRGHDMEINLCPRSSQRYLKYSSTLSYDKNAQVISGIIKWTGTCQHDPVISRESFSPCQRRQ